MDHPWMYTMDEYGETPTTRARKSGYTVLAEMLLSQEKRAVAPPSAPVGAPQNGEAYWGMSHTVRKLVSEEPTRQEPISDIDRCLHEATREGDVKKVRQLLEEGANADQFNEQGLTPLHWSALNGRQDLAAVLLDHGADINAREEYTGKLTPMAMALLMGYDDLVELMAGRGGIC